MTRRRNEHPELWHGGFGRVEVRHIQPYQADKEYICPGCGHPIPVGTGHRVAVPSQAPDLRRHWHHACWERETMRGRRRGEPRAVPGHESPGIAAANGDDVAGRVAGNDARTRLRSRRRQLR